MYSSKPKHCLSTPNLKFKYQVGTLGRDSGEVMAANAKQGNTQRCYAWLATLRLGVISCSQLGVCFAFLP